jgi:hypothetical protein
MTPRAHDLASDDPKVRERHPTAPLAPQGAEIHDGGKRVVGSQEAVLRRTSL